MRFAWYVATGLIVGIMLVDHLFEIVPRSDPSHVASNVFMLGVALGILDAKFSHQ
jgi:hypothetical protein